MKLENYIQLSSDERLHISSRLFQLPTVHQGTM